MPELSTSASTIRYSRSLPWLLVLALSLTSFSGCINLASNLMYAWRGNKAPAEYNGFEGKKVAIVCGTEKGLSNDATSTLMTRQLEGLLGKNVKDIKLIGQDKIDKWLDTNGWNDSDFTEIGKGVGADQVLSISLANLTLKDGMTLYKGRANISVTVYDIAGGGNVVYRKGFPDFEYPKLGGATVTDTSEAKFHVLFLRVVSQRIATLFYPADPNDQFALDAISNSL